MNHTWAYFTSIASAEAPPPEDAPAEQPPQRAAGEEGDPTGGAVAGVARMTRFRAIASVAGSVLPAREGDRVRIQLRSGRRWVTLESARVGAGGRYRAAVVRPGTYRAVYRGAAGPDVRVG